MESINKNEQRYDFIDTMKFIAAFLIIVMHVLTPVKFSIFQVVQTGVLATFFFCSGFVFKETNNKESTIKYIIKNIKKYIIFYMVVVALDLLLGYIRPDYYQDVTIEKILNRAFFVGQPVLLGHMWFLLSLFWCSCTFFIIWKIVGFIKNEKIRYILICVIFIFVLFFANNFNYDYNDNFNIDLPLKINSSLFGLIFYIAGFLFKKIHVLCFDKVKIYLKSMLKDKAVISIFKVFVLILFFVIFRSVAIYIEIKFLKYTNICDCRLSNYPLCLIAQFSSIISYIFLSMLITNKIFAYCGKINLWIYLVHPVVMWCVEEAVCRYEKINRKYYFLELKEVMLISIVVYLISCFIAIIIDNVNKISNK